ncbi:hypothetical protein C3731_15875 [Brucella oryzae]|uniref:Uncharacterized protein n=1 Tax=Brucella oryzae TaxID=335286 RepID=A0A2S7IX24_9HYPH|nr:hypothetical protein C3731_15875 [Brucella oryzae]
MLFSHCPVQNRSALLLEMLFPFALSCVKPLRTFTGNAVSIRIIPRKTASHFYWKCSYENYFLIRCPISPIQSISLYGIFRSIKSNGYRHDTGTAANFH